MANHLSNREKRTIKAGMICAVVILGGFFMPEHVTRWRFMKAEIIRMENTLKEVRGFESPSQATLMRIVPVFQMPSSREKQSFLFRDKVNEQIKEAGLKEQPLQTYARKLRNKGGYAPLMVQYKGKGEFDKLLEFLVILKKNPYYVGIEELTVKCDPEKPPENREDADIEFTLLTFTNQ